MGIEVRRGAKIYFRCQANVFWGVRVITYIFQRDIRLLLCLLQQGDELDKLGNLALAKQTAEVFTLIATNSDAKRDTQLAINWFAIQMGDICSARHIHRRVCRQNCV